MTEKKEVFIDETEIEKIGPIISSLDELRKEIEKHRYLYHVLDSPEISDSALDSLKHELEQLEIQYY